MVPEVQTLRGDDLGQVVAVPVEPVQKPNSYVANDKPCFDRATGTSQMSTSVVTQASEVIVTGALLFRPPGMLLPA